MKEQNTNRTITLSFKVTIEDAEIIEDFAIQRSISRSELIYRTLFNNLNKDETIKQLKAQVKELQKENNTLKSVYPFMRSNQ